MNAFSVHSQLNKIQKKSLRIKQPYEWADLSWSLLWCLRHVNINNGGGIFFSSGKPSMVSFQSLKLGIINVWNIEIVYIQC